MPVITHVLRRTSMDGQPVVRTCVICGGYDLPKSATGQECPNPNGLTAEGVAALLEQIAAEDRASETDDGIPS